MSFNLLMYWVIYIIIKFVGVVSQDVTLNEPQRFPQCNVKYFTIDGQAIVSDPDWDNVDIGIQRRSTDETSFTTIGSFLANQGCNGYRPGVVYCESQSTSVYNFVINVTTLYGATIRATWTNNRFNNVSSSEQTLPEEDGEDEAVGTLMLGTQFNIALINQSFSFEMKDNSPVTFCGADTNSDYSSTLTFQASVVLNQSVTSSERCISKSSWPVITGNGSIKIEYNKTDDTGCTQRGILSGIVTFFKCHEEPNIAIPCVSMTFGIIVIVLGWTYEWWIACFSKCGEKKKGAAPVSSNNRPDPPVEMRLAPINSSSPASPNTPKHEPVTTTNSNEEKTRKKKKKTDNVVDEDQEKKDPKERKKKMKKAGESGKATEQTDQVRPLPSPRMVGEPGMNTSATSPVALRSNFSASLVPQGNKSDTRPTSIEVTTQPRTLPQPKKRTN